ncbi:MAG: acyl carrier protein [Gammaproteobacteria bacterium]|nr:acyl carrier protein [Gammaproteobacteria bacterium]
MNTEDVLKKYIVNRFLHGEDSNLLGDDELLLKGIIDSMGIIELVSFIEAQFEITVQNDELVPDNFQTVNNIKGFIERKQVI